jgi:DNA-binding transcriptional MerR regulator
MPAATAASKKPLRLRIGELAARTGRSPDTIRWYERQGLLPTVPREGPYRIYSNRHVEWLELMERLRGSGMSVAQLRAYTASAQRGAAALAQTHALLVAHRARVEEQIREWRRASKVIDGKIAFYAQWMETGQRPGSTHDAGPHAPGSRPTTAVSRR